METILKLDAALFHLINGKLTAPWLDVVMPFVTEKFNFTGAVIAAAVGILILGKRKDRIGLVVLVLAVLASDIIANQLKHIFMRIRPCNALDGVRVVLGCSGSYSLPSGHATNIFAAMVFLAARYRRLFLVFLAFAGLVSYSRVYVGVHYPTDVLAGAAVGSGVAVFFAWAEIKAAALYEERCGGKRGASEEE
ncbi:MAG: phosphatase PAP2 family protein [Deltaproteobacteria bacterium]|nr:phosphatase PAP2 family protein [Deltaproteobacteria bacterium]